MIELFVLGSLAAAVAIGFTIYRLLAEFTSINEDGCAFIGIIWPLVPALAAVVGLLYGAYYSLNWSIDKFIAAIRGVQAARARRQAAVRVPVAKVEKI